MKILGESKIPRELCFSTKNSKNSGFRPNICKYLQKSVFFRRRDEFPSSDTNFVFRDEFSGISEKSGCGAFKRLFLRMSRLGDGFPCSEATSDPGSGVQTGSRTGPRGARFSPRFYPRFRARFGPKSGVKSVTILSRICG